MAGEGGQAADAADASERSESLHADVIGAALASAMQSWCNRRDPKEMRRLLLELLLVLDAQR
jgi:hypothetical protein